jgi:chorismate synthase
VAEDELRAVVPVAECMMALVLLDVMLERAKYQG